MDRLSHLETHLAPNLFTMMYLYDLNTNINHFIQHIKEFAMDYHSV